MPYLIDGYNLLRTVQKTDEQFCSLTEVGLCRMFSEYLDRSRDHGRIVFDGIGPPDKDEHARLHSFTNIKVRFSGRDLQADDIIEQKIEDNTAPKRLIVVSTDRRIRAAASKRKAISITSDVFWQTLTRVLDSPIRTNNEPSQKRHPITEPETDHWLEYFGLDDD